MLQQIIAYFILTLASLYVIYRGYDNLKKKKGCDKCELMKAAKSTKSPTS